MILLLAQALLVPLGLDSFVPAPVENPLTAETIALGQRLFADKRLSADGTVSCASCHVASRAFTDEFALARGIGGQVGERRTPRILNRAWGASFFWDGRSPTLEDQVLQPVENPLEMNLRADLAAERVGLTVAALRFALAAYVRSILSGDSPYDRYLAGDAAALTVEQRAGLALFRGKAGCASCHVGPNLTDEKLHNTGLGKFRTPGLREVARTPPYMHDGSLRSLESVIDFYDDGGKAVADLDPDIGKLGLTVAEKRSLIAFLQALNGRVQHGVAP